MPRKIGKKQTVAFIVVRPGRPAEELFASALFSRASLFDARVARADGVARRRRSPPGVAGEAPASPSRTRAGALPRAEPRGGTLGARVALQIRFSFSPRRPSGRDHDIRGPHGRRAMACCGTRSRVDGPDVCTLCLEALPLPGPGADVVLKLHACGHCFHRDCAQEMLLDALRKFQKPRCPNCRATLSTAPFGKLLGQRRQPRLKRMQNMRELISVSEVRSLAPRRANAPGAAPANDVVLTSARSACFSPSRSPRSSPRVARSRLVPHTRKMRTKKKHAHLHPPLSFSPSRRST